MPSTTSVISAELRLYINYSLVQEGVESDELMELKSQDFLITLYEIGLEDSMSFVDRVELKQNQEGWIAFNVSLVLGHWLLKPDENFGLQLVCRTEEGRILDLIRCC